MTIFRQNTYIFEKNNTFSIELCHHFLQNRDRPNLKYPNWEVLLRYMMIEHINSYT